MLKKYFNAVIPAQTTDDLKESVELKQTIQTETQNVFKFMEGFDVSKSLASIFNIFGAANRYIELTQPWALAKDESKKDTLAAVMRNLLESIRIGTSLLQPFLPDCSQKTLEALKTNSTDFKDINEFYALKAGETIESPGILFPRLDIAAELEKLKNF